MNFLQSVHDDLLIRMFPAARLDPVGDTNPMVTRSGNGMTDVRIPRFANSSAHTPMLQIGGPPSCGKDRDVIIILPLDMTSGMLGADNWGIAGYENDYSLQLMKNIVLWAWDGCPDANL